MYGVLSYARFSGVKIEIMITAGAIWCSVVQKEEAAI